MSRLGEITLIKHLTEKDSMSILVAEGLDAELLPTDALRKVYGFAIEYFFAGGQTAAPTIEVLQTEYGLVLDDNEIDLTEDPEETIEWAIQDLRGTFLYNNIADFNKRLANAMAAADSVERIQVANEYATEMIALAMSAESRSRSVDVRTVAPDLMADYEERKLSQDGIRGMTFGLPMIDNYTHGIHAGELAILAAPPKSGKSYFLCSVALNLYRRGEPTALYSLELPIETMLDRIACLATAVSSRKWQHGRCDPEEEERVRAWITDAKKADSPLWICQPDLGARSFEAMVHDAQVRGCRNLLIDQLTYVELPDPRKPKHERIGDALHRLHAMIAAGRTPMPCLMAHQINREGVRAAAKVGHLEMFHLADAAEIERTADWVFGHYRSNEERMTDRAKFQTLAARRDDPKHYQMVWNIDASFISVQQEIEIG